MRMMLGLTLAAVLATAAAAQDVTPEVKTLKGRKVTVYPYAFLNAEELKVLRLVQTNEQALQLFITSPKGFSAMAMAPKDGLVRNGTFPATVAGMGDLPDAPNAAAAALKACEAKRKGGKPCVVVLEVAPK